MKKHIIALSLLSLLSVSTVSCDRFLDITPTGKAIPKTVEDYRAVLTRAYSLYPAHRAVIQSRTDEVQLNPSSDEVVSYKDLFLWKDSSRDPATVEVPYGQFYSVIFYANHTILQGAKDMPEGAEKNQILGEAYALRALCNFELVNLFAPMYEEANGSALAVPLVLEIDLEKTYPRATVQQVYAQILADVQRAESLLSVNQFDAGLNYRFTKVALDAFSARIYQYMGDWGKALSYAQKVLAVNGRLEDFNRFSVLPSSFRSVESIMNLDANLNSNTNSVYRASENLIGLYDQTNDLRFAKYFRRSGTLYQSTKFASSNELKSSFRVGEIYLLKAEAEYKLRDEQSSKNTLLALAATRYNAQGLAVFKAKVEALSGEEYLKVLYGERQRELAFEGLRWYDLRRTGKPEMQHQYEAETAVMQQGDDRYVLPFPASARLKNPNL
ncbi:RagB/SusD family nutrient uptake outer membrane protein [Bergeyella sp. RCAD1439]|uniref:RagB/SusD family nutrient uptake outer membrane protein n=1 Tax=Bergeyella anatis TaxID=3113737 RepID=UPI002E196075|nr:RagB/SusD family nutrient uptake outer membrane protein [Bergeyella sp. RCAD1439]